MQSYLFSIPLQGLTSNIQYNMKKIILNVIVASLFTFTSFAQGVKIIPQPDSIQASKGTITITGYSLEGDTKADPQAIALLKKALVRETPATKKAIRIIIGEKGDKAVSKYAKQIPAVPGGYYLTIDSKQVIIAGYDGDGTYYGVQSFVQMLGIHTLPQVTIFDAPDITYRGVVEGFYGTPWSQRDRISLLNFMGQVRMNTYIYGPKDDPYHSSPNWRQPYPAKEAAQISELAKIAKENKVNFVWAIHPGKDIQWNAADSNAVIAKFDSMYTLGVRAFAVFFDDISGEGTNPGKQAGLLNYINTQFIQKKKDVAPLVMCPTEYNKSWSNPAKGSYLDILGEKLQPSVHIMWTGDKVISDITSAGLDSINARIKRPAYIWWNFPVSDYVRDHLLMGSSYGLDTDIATKMSGFVSNPMERAEASKLAIFSMGEYCWNMKAYKPGPSWERAMKAVMPSEAAALRVFASHNSDPGPNGHGYRRDESAEIKPTVDRFIKGLAEGKFDPKDVDALIAEYKKMIEASSALLKCRDNDELIEEIRPWLLQFDLLGKKGVKILELVKLYQKDKGLLFWNNFRSISEFDLEMQKIDKTYNQNPYQPGVKSGSLVMNPLTIQIREILEKDFFNFLQEGINNKKSAPATQSFPILKSDIRQLSKSQLLSGENTLSIAPVNEVIKVKAGQSIALSLPILTDLVSLVVNTGTTDHDWISIEQSGDNQQWTPLTAQSDSLSLTCDLRGTVAKFIRLINKTDQEKEMYLKQFTLTTVQSLSPENNISQAMDGNFNSNFWLKGGATIAINNTLLWNNFTSVINQKNSPYKLGSALLPIEKVTLLTSPEANTNITLFVIDKNGKRVKAGTFTSSISVIPLVNYSDIKSVELKNNSGSAAQIFEMIWTGR